MKKLLTLVALVIVLYGCNDAPVNPVESESKSYELIKLPTKPGLLVENTYSKTETINGAIGGEIEIVEEYVAADGNTVEIYAKLIVPKNAFAGDVPITMTIDDVYAAVWFTPHMVFDLPVKLKMSFKGIDLEELMLVSGKYDLLYIHDDGSTEVVGYDEVHVVESEGAIKVQNASLEHFSRYGFTR